MVDPDTVPWAASAADPAAAPGIEAFAVLAGRYRWLEQELFQILGGWVATVPEPEVQAVLSTHSFHHAWHAQLWRERQPLFPGFDADETATAPMGHDMVAFVAALAAPQDSGADDREAGGRLSGGAALSLLGLCPAPVRSRTRSRTGRPSAAFDLIGLDLIDDRQAAST